MEAATRDLVLSRRLSLVIIIGFIGIFASPFTQYYGPLYPIYSVQVFQEDLVLNDDFPVWEFGYPLADKLVIEELTTNGSSVIIWMYNPSFSGAPITIIQNVTEIKSIFLIGDSSEDSRAPLFRISRTNNESVHISITIRIWGTYLSTDYISVGPSIFLFLAIPLAYSLYRYWGYRLKKTGYGILILILLIAVLLTPFLVYTYNHGATVLRHDVIQDTHSYSFMLNASDYHQEIHGSIDTTDTDSFVRITEINTNGTPVSIIVDFNEDAQSLHLSNISISSPNQTQIELPRGTSTGFTLQFDWIGQNTSISFSIETVSDIWAPWIDPLPYYLSGLVGLVVMVISLIIPRNRESQLPDKSSLS